MPSTLESRTSSSAAHSWATIRRVGSTRLHAVARRSRQAAVTLVLVGSGFLAGLTPAANAGVAAPVPLRLAPSAPTSVTDATEDERALAARLTAGYAGAVPAADIEALVRQVSQELRDDFPPSARLLATVEAASRRALTDYLARGVPLPADHGGRLSSSSHRRTVTLRT